MKSISVGANRLGACLRYLDPGARRVTGKRLFRPWHALVGSPVAARGSGRADPARHDLHERLEGSTREVPAGEAAPVLDDPTSTLKIVAGVDPSEGGPVRSDIAR